MRFRPPHPLRLLSLAAAIVAVCSGHGLANPAPSPATPSPVVAPVAGPNILILVGEDPTSRWVPEMLDGLRSRIEARRPTATIYFEYIDLLRFPSAQVRDDSAALFAAKYRDTHLDLIVAISGGALGLIASHLQQEWPGVPVVYPTMASKIDVADRIHDVTAMIMDNPLPAMIATIRALLPGTRRLAVISGGAAIERARGQWYLGQFSSAGFAVIDLGALRLQDLLSRVASLPDDTAIFMESLQVGPDGRQFPSTDPCTVISSAANRPVFMLGQGRMGCGIVGGPLVDWGRAGERLADVALDRLAGRAPPVVPLKLADVATPSFDARALARWAIPESRLPAGSQVLFRQPSLWRDYRKTTIGTIVVLAALTAAVAGLLVEQRRRRRAQGQLSQSHREIQTLVGRLISAREAERAVVARDLHDDLGQNLALLSIDVDRLAGTIRSEEFARRVDAISRRAADISASMHALSHRLHPTKLETLGLAAGLESLCHEVADVSGVTVAFDGESVDSTISRDAALCLYRITQEALQNVLKHSGATTASVTLTASADSVEVQIRDNGHGFRTGRVSGLGLVSMRERTHLVGGTLQVDSSPGLGTRVMVRVPIGGAGLTQPAYPA